MIIDTHFHAFPTAYVERLPALSPSAQGKQFRHFNAAEYLAVMDQYGIGLGVFSNQAAPVEQLGDRSLALDLCRALNDSFIQAAVDHPGRFRAFARLPMLDMDDAVRELERIRGERAIVGVVSPTNVAGRYLDEPVFAPVWQAIEAARVPLFLHPTYSPSQANWEPFSFRHKILWPVDTTLALSRIVSSGTLDRYPGVSIIAAHLGGPALLLLDRLNWNEGEIASEREAEHYFRNRIYYDIAGPSRAAGIAFAAATVGVGQLLFGADFPHGRGGRDDAFYPLAIKAMEDVELSAGDKDRIYFRNAQALGLG